MAAKYNCYPDKVKKVLLEDPYRPLHNWNMFKHLEKLKKVTGIEPKKGHWSNSEKQQLEENMVWYQSLNPNVDVFKLIYERTNKARTTIFNQTCFWDILSYNLCRRMEIIHMFLLRKYCKKAGYKTGALSKQEYACLKQLVKKHGKNWALISSLMNRTPDNVCTIYNLSVKNKINEGPWHEEEKEKFICIVKRLIEYNKKHDSPLHKISWRIVSDFVLTRSAYGCRNFAQANKNMLENLLSHNSYFTLLSKEAIILYIYFSQNKSEADFKWDELFILFNGKYTESELRREYNNISILLPDCDKIKTEYKNLFQIAENLFSRVNFENVLLTMQKPRTTAYLKAKYYILIKESLPKTFKKKTEEIIMILHDKYVSKLIQNESVSAQSQTPDLVEQSTTRDMMEPSIDLTLISNDDELPMNDINEQESYFFDLTRLSDSDNFSEEEDAVMIIG